MVRIGPEPIPCHGTGMSPQAPKLIRSLPEPVSPTLLFAIAVTVAPEYRRLGIAAKFMEDLEVKSAK